MPDHFPLNEAYLSGARSVVDQPHIYWLLGGSASGKSTIAALLAGNTPAHLDVDTLIFERFMPHYTPDKHPASWAWLRSPSPLAWVLSLSWPAFNALTRAADAEALALLAELLGSRPAAPLLIDGGFAHPGVVARAASPERMVCLSAPEAARRAAWETAPGRAAMRDWIHALPEPAAKWETFLDFDARQAATMRQECLVAGVPIIDRLPGEAPTATAARVRACLGLENL